MKALWLPIVPVLLCCALLPASGLGKREQALTGVVGNLLQHPSPAADFALTDQHGATFRMSEARGKVVLMTFIYTHCTDICPFLAVKVKGAYDLLRADADKVVIVAVTTDPKRDVPKVTAAYSRELGLFDAWHFVGGPAEAVQAVWANYGIGVTIDPDTSAAAPPRESASGTASGQNSDEPIQGLSHADLSLAGRIGQEFGGGYDVGHSAPFWIVDKKGMIRVGMDAGATPADIVTNVRVLLKLK
jgi:cytochrome oxidase Cu insertion factor (SCO1/SenC/PrrC family)